MHFYIKRKQYLPVGKLHLTILTGRSNICLYIWEVQNFCKLLYIKYNSCGNVHFLPHTTYKGIHAVDCGFPVLDYRFFISETWSSGFRSLMETGFFELCSGFWSPGSRISQAKHKTKSLTSFLEHPICENGHGPCTPSQSPTMGFWWSSS